MGMCVEAAVPAQVTPAETEQEVRRGVKREVKQVCRHCGQPANARRGLCWACYDNPEVCANYGRQAETTVPLLLAQDRVEPLPEEPTPYQPGTEEKVRVFCARLLAGTSLWHPLDPRI